MRLPALDEVRPEPFTAVGNFYLEAWQFCAAWRPSGGFGLGSIRLGDLERFMAEARLNPEERALCRRLVGRTDAAYRNEANRLAAKSGKGK